MIKGLTITGGFISQDYESNIIKNICSEQWNTTLSRRTQHYGYTYNYKNKTITDGDYLGPFPNWLNELTDYLVENAKLDRKPDQVIINEYLPGQGIGPHIDMKDIFDDHICSLSLGSNAIFVYSNKKDRHEFYLKRRSLLEMTGEARYDWLHSMPSRKFDKVNGNKVGRGVRYSITFRKIIKID